MMSLQCSLPMKCLTQCLRDGNHSHIYTQSPFLLPLYPTNMTSLKFSSRKASFIPNTPKPLITSASKAVELVLGNRRDDDDDSDDDNDNNNKEVPLLMTEEERAEFRRKIREVMDAAPDVQEETDPVQRKIKMQKLLAEYPLVVEEDDPDWPEEDADGWGFSLNQFFNKITIKNVKKDDDEDYDSDKEVVWQDDNYIKPIRDITATEWEDTVFKDFNPLIILVHNRYKRPRENETARDELEKAVKMFWETGLPSPRCAAVDAVVEDDIVDALKVSTFPEIIFTKAGKILYREKVVRPADEWSKIMAFFYYKAARPPFLSETAGNSEEKIPHLA